MSSATNPVPIANSELRHLTASHNGQEYEIKVRLPEQYDETDETYPVLYSPFMPSSKNRPFFSG